MFATIRWRLVAWTMLVVASILLVLGTVVYLALSESLLDEVDRGLLSRGDQAELSLDAMLRGGRDDRSGYRGGIFYVVLGPDGRVLANPQRVNLGGVRFPPAAGRRGSLATIQVNGESTRVLTRTIDERVPGTLVIGQSLVPEESALRSLLLVLVAGGALGLVLSFAAAWFLAGRALVPIEQAFRRQQELVADASHELRTPLTVLRSATDLLNRHRAEPLAANGELFDDLRSEITRLERLAGDLLTLARSDRDELELAVAPVDLGVLAAEVVRRLDPLARERGVALSAQQEPGAVVVEADPDRLGQVLLILLDNALKHTPAGGRVTVDVHRQGADAVAEVADTGSGIAPEHLPRIFDRFYRADLARSRAEGGSGLGLAIAKTLIEAHDGAIWLSSTPGVGTRATFRLRLADQPSRATWLARLPSRLAQAATPGKGLPRPEP